MIKKKGKAVSFDAMVKFFIQYYDLPTKTDIDKLVERIDRLEMLMRDIATGAPSGRRAARRRRTTGSRQTVTAADTVYDAMQTFKNGADLADIQAKTGFGEKKLRNIIYRLHKLGRIQRLSRGVYRVRTK